MTPNKMMLGREVNLPSELIFKNVREELFENEEQYVTSLRNNTGLFPWVVQRDILSLGLSPCVMPSCSGYTYYMI
jgi:hypothetical protein